MVHLQGGVWQMGNFFFGQGSTLVTTSHSIFSTINAPPVFALTVGSLPFTASLLVTAGEGIEQVKMREVGKMKKWQMRVDREVRQRMLQGGK